MSIQFVLALLLAAAGVKVSVLAPDSLKQIYPSGIAAKSPKFGEFPFGSYVAGVLLSINSTCCESFCTDAGFNTTHPFIFLIPKGNCQYTYKVNLAERAGARAVLIYNTQTSQDADLMDSAEPFENSIPSALLSTGDGMRLKDVKDIVVKVSFRSSNLQHTVKVKSVQSLNPHLDSQIVSALPAIHSFAGILTFEPYFSLKSCPNCQMPDARCICQNLYCSLVDSGRHVIQETIRQHCVFNLTTTQHDYMPYVDYLLKWYANCYKPPMKACNYALAAAGVDPVSVQKCYLATFLEGNEDGTDNFFLASEVNVVHAEFLPMLTVNGDVVYGSIGVPNLRRAICAHLNFTHPACAHFFCAPGCWPDMRNNMLCDSECNVAACRFDNGECVSHNFVLPPDSSDTPPVVDPPQPKPSPNDPSDDNPDDIVPANCLCDINELRSSSCLPKCNNTDCFYQNWTCACAPGCTPEMLANEGCDAACNNTACKYDSHACSESTDFTSTRSEIKHFDILVVGISTFIAALVLTAIFCVMEKLAAQKQERKEGECRLTGSESLVDSAEYRDSPEGLELQPNSSSEFMDVNLSRNK